jgi:hypothetical protein
MSGTYLSLTGTMSWAVLIKKSSSTQYKTSENPPHWTSHVSMSRCMLDILDLCTLCDDALFKFAQSSRNAPSGLSCGMFPSLLTNQHKVSCSTCWHSCLSISDLLCRCCPILCPYYYSLCLFPYCDRTVAWFFPNLHHVYLLLLRSLFYFCYC